MGPVINSYISLASAPNPAMCQWEERQTLGTSPLKKAEAPSFLAMLVKMRKPLSGFSKLRFWMRVLMTSSGADTINEAEAPAMDATKFWNQVALL